MKSFPWTRIILVLILIGMVSFIGFMFMLTSEPYNLEILGNYESIGAQVFIDDKTAQIVGRDNKFTQGRLVLGTYSDSSEHSNSLGKLNIPAGKHTIKIIREGYKPVLSELNVPSNTNHRNRVICNLNLARDTSNQVSSFSYSYTDL